MNTPIKSSGPKRSALALSVLLALSPLVGGLTTAQAKPPAHAKAHGYRAKQGGKGRSKRAKNRTKRHYERQRDRDHDYERTRNDDYDRSRDYDYDTEYERDLRRQQKLEAATSILGSVLSR